LHPEETPASLPPQLAPLTLTERRRAFWEEALQSAASARTLAEDRVARRQAEEACWPCLRETAERIAAARQLAQEAPGRLSRVADEVERDAQPDELEAGESQPAFAGMVAQLERTHLETLTAVKTDLQAQESQHAAAAAELAELREAEEALRPLADAKQWG